MKRSFLAVRRTPRIGLTVKAVVIVLLVTIVSVVTRASKVEMMNGDGTELLDIAGARLNAGLLTPGRDGDLLQLGYFDLGTVANPFLGNWIPLTGEGSRNGWLSAVGDETIPRAAANGRFSIGVFFLGGSPTRGYDLPPRPAMPLAIRFYDGPSIAEAEQFNTVSNVSGKWNWRDDVNTTIHVDLADNGLVWEAGSGSTFRTTLAVPEPRAPLLLAVGTWLTLGMRLFPATRQRGRADLRRGGEL